MTNHELREKLAAVQHEIWSYWMSYLFKVSTYNDDGSVTIPPDKVTKWAEQLKTDYFWLSEEERESDRHQADKVLAVLTGEKRMTDSLTTIAELMAAIEKVHTARGYSRKPQTLLLGAMEEMGELAQAILLTWCSDFVPSSRKQKSIPLLGMHGFDPANVALEVGDVITYLLALCNSLRIKPHFKVLETEE